jgi:AcrR family transcriptional regulator
MNKEYLRKGRTGQKQKTREKILLAAKELQERDDEFTLEKVAEHAGVSRATIYRYYSDKDVLSAEAVLDMRTLTPAQILEDYQDADLESTLLGIQEYYNKLTIDNERAFRKYLSVLLNPDNQVSLRGARRVRTLTEAIEQKKAPISAADRNRLVYLATLMMGVEAFIVTRDVCRLDEKASEDVLQWGLKTLLKGITREEQ